jgi:hypothetical protein
MLRRSSGARVPGPRIVRGRRGPPHLRGGGGGGSAAVLEGRGPRPSGGLSPDMPPLRDTASAARLLHEKGSVRKCASTRRSAAGEFAERRAAGDPAGLRPRSLAREPEEGDGDGREERACDHERDEPEHHRGIALVRPQRNALADDVALRRELPVARNELDDRGGVFGLQRRDVGLIGRAPVRATPLSRVRDVRYDPSPRISRAGGRFFSRARG